MQRWCTKLRSLTLRCSNPPTSLHPFYPPLLLCSSAQRLQCPRKFSVISSVRRPLFDAPSSSHLSLHLGVFLYPPNPTSLVQIRHISTKEKKRKKVRERKPMTPATSKMKKIKMKSYSSYKSRFRTMNDGKIRRWKEGKRHNAHLKSKRAKRRLRLPAVVPAAYAKVMKKLNFCG
ncbi:uncharacterized protein LOC131164097 [Malania oleifera]|uniref:uncharacterized protein LOC131164097 n=1 Tax=Malania oleifera TaxID=397392 RepID=UPI0025AE7E23|nr:uncharacterized protein LOC131164097 [Malania oleifera]